MVLLAWETSPRFAILCNPLSCQYQFFWQVRLLPPSPHALRSHVEIKASKEKAACDNKLIKVRELSNLLSTTLRLDRKKAGRAAEVIHFTTPTHTVKVSKETLGPTHLGVRLPILLKDRNQSHCGLKQCSSIVKQALHAGVYA